VEIDRWEADSSLGAAVWNRAQGSQQMIGPPRARRLLWIASPTCRSAEWRAEAGCCRSDRAASHHGVRASST
jgi:hypothetical protein